MASLAEETKQQTQQTDRGYRSEYQASDTKIASTFFYQIANMKAMKIVVLIKISNLKYQLEEMIENDPNIPFYLRTEKGQLKKQYEIIQYIIHDSRENSKSEINIDIDILQGAHEQHKSNNTQNDGGAYGTQSSTEHPHTDEQDNPTQSSVINLCGDDIFLFSKMNEALHELRVTLFPLLEEFYRYLLGHQKVKKTRYESLINKIKIEIANLDSHINEHSDVYAYENSFLNIVIACELFMGCKFAFEEKFRKSKYSLFNKYQSISKKTQFEEIYGKTTLCMKQYVPPEFEADDDPIIPGANVEASSKKAEEPLNSYSQAHRISSEHQLQSQQPPTNSQQTLQNFPTSDNDRNELLYNYFRSVFTQNDQKKNYFPYFWLMFQSLKCTLIQVRYTQLGHSLEQLIQKIKMLQFELQKYLKDSTVDYGIIGVFEEESQKNFIVKGLLCLGSKSFEDLKKDIDSSVELKEWMINKIDVNKELQKKEVESLWENVQENSNYEGLITCAILYI